MARIRLEKDGVPFKLYADRPEKPAAGKLHVGDLNKITPDLPQPWDRDTVLRRYPRIVAHMIAESLGYFTPSSAAKALADAMNGVENWCEYIYSCYKCDPVAMVKRAIECRKMHTGYMAEYEKGMALVAREIAGLGDPNAMAGWF